MNSLVEVSHLSESVSDIARILGWMKPIFFTIGSIFIVFGMIKFVMAFREEDTESYFNAIRELFLGVSTCVLAVVVIPSLLSNVNTNDVDTNTNEMEVVTENPFEVAENEVVDKKPPIHNDDIGNQPSFIEENETLPIVIVCVVGIVVLAGAYLYIKNKGKLMEALESCEEDSNSNDLGKEDAFKNNEITSSVQV